jgi:hypothetical protein
MVKKKFGIELLIFATLVFMAFTPVVNAQKDDYSVTSEKVFEHANAHMIRFIANDAPDFEN